MKVFAVLVVTFGLLAYVRFTGDGSGGGALPEVAAAEGVRTARTTFAELAAAGASFADVARPGVYTVFVVSSKRCPPCRTLEAQLPAFLAKRKDVVVMIVDVTSGVPAVDQPDLGRVRSTPHVEIHGPGGDVVVRDDGRDKAGYRRFAEWLAGESRGVSPSAAR